MNPHRRYADACAMLRADVQGLRAWASMHREEYTRRAVYLPANLLALQIIGDFVWYTETTATATAAN